MSYVAEHSQKMDSIYRYQKYIYDFTRKYYLLGRDRVIYNMDLQPGDTVLEMGCGTARNLILLAKRNPQNQFYGIDASEEMLKVANKKISQAGLQKQINCKTCLAENATYQDFGLQEPFDCIFFSYSLSMIPTWQQAIQNALDHLKPGGHVYIVDFWDQGGWPRWFQGLLKGWLKLFHVQHRPELLDYIKSLDSWNGSVNIEAIFRRYSFFVRLQKK